VYFCRIVAPGFTASRRMVLLEWDHRVFCERQGYRARIWTCPFGPLVISMSTTSHRITL
jgi:hypothetical protein